MKTILCAIILSCSCFAQDSTWYNADSSEAYIRIDTTSKWKMSDTISFRSYPKTDTVQYGVTYANNSGHVYREVLNCIRSYTYCPNVWMSMKDIQCKWYNKKWKRIYVGVILDLWDAGFERETFLNN